MQTVATHEKSIVTNVQVKSEKLLGQKQNPI